MSTGCRDLVIALCGAWLVACDGGSGGSESVGSAMGSAVGSCADPAPLIAPHVQGPGPYVVVLDQNLDAREESQRLGMQYGFTAKSVFLFGFEADLDAGTVLQLRCETAVESIHFDDGTFGVL